MRLWFAILSALISTAALSEPEVRAGREYPGYFSNVTATGPGCQAYFAKETYRPVVHILQNPRGVLVHFPKDDANPGFFNGQNIVGSRGYSDVVLEKEIPAPDGRSKARLRAEGILDEGAVYFVFNIHRLKVGTTTVECEATAEFAGFSDNSLQ